MWPGTKKTVCGETVLMLLLQKEVKFICHEMFGYQIGSTDKFIKSRTCSQLQGLYAHCRCEANVRLWLAAAQWNGLKSSENAGTVVKHDYDAKESNQQLRRQGFVTCGCRSGRTTHDQRLRLRVSCRQRWV